MALRDLRPLSLHVASFVGASFVGASLVGASLVGVCLVGVCLVGPGVLFAAATHSRKPPAGSVVALTTRPGSRLEHDAASLVANDIAAAHKAHEVPVMLVGSARLSTQAGRAALFVQVQSASLCGSAGCSTSVFTEQGHGWTRVLDSVSGPVKVSPRTHGGMHDLLVHGTDRWVWNGKAYSDTLPALGPVGGAPTP